MYQNRCIVDISTTPVIMARKNITEDKLILRLQEISRNGILDAENADRSENMHRIFMYPAMMVPATQSAIIQAFSDILPPNTYAIDPFMGSGTSLLSCIEFGFNVFGQDINPLAVLLSKAKTTTYDIAKLRNTLDNIKTHITQDNCATIEVYFSSINKWFSKEAQISFSKIRRAIDAEKDIKYRYFFWVLMSEAIRVCSNDRTSTFKLHRRSAEELEHRNVNIIQKFLSIAACGINDYESFQSKLKNENDSQKLNFRGNTEIVWGNSQLGINTKRKFNILLSSPPYGDNHTTVTYGQTSYLPLQWIPSKDIECPYDYLRTTQEIDRQSLGGKIDNKTLDIRRMALFEKTKHLKYFYSKIPQEEKFKYKKTIIFIADFEESLRNIIKVMDDDAYYIWTIGNRFVGGREVPNAEILQDLMEHHGINLFFKAERQIFNKKQANKNNHSKTMEKEQILIFHRKHQ